MVVSGKMNADVWNLEDWLINVHQLVEQALVSLLGRGGVIT